MLAPTKGSGCVRVTIDWSRWRLILGTCRPGSSYTPSPLDHFNSTYFYLHSETEAAAVLRWLLLSFVCLLLVLLFDFVSGHMVV